MKVGIIGCGAIANIITGSITSENNGIEIAYFFDKDIERAENLASLAGGVAALDFDEMLNNVDLVLECASPDSVKEYAPIVLKKGIDMIIMSIGAFMDTEFYNTVLNVANRIMLKFTCLPVLLLVWMELKQLLNSVLKKLNLLLVNLQDLLVRILILKRYCLKVRLLRQLNSSH